MTQPIADIKVNYAHVVLRGAPEAIGQEQAAAIKNTLPYLDFFRSGKGVFPTAKEFDKVYTTFDRYCPGLNQEIHAFAKALEIPPEHIIYYASTYLSKGHCSHMAALPKVTEDGHLLVGRSYEFGDKADDHRLCTTHVAGKNAHIGFSTMFFGRSEGMNEHGLSVTMSSGGIPVGNAPGQQPPVQDGLQFWALVRLLLESCNSVDAALEMMREIPLGGNPILILADRGGKAAKIEIYGPHKEIRVISGQDEEAVLFATNHFTLPEMQKYCPVVMRNSSVRYQAIGNYLTGPAPVNRDSLKGFLSSLYPKGVCCHYYQEFFGTLYSIIFDLADLKADICFGSPAVGDWHTIDFDTPGRSIQITLPQEHSSPDFWK